MNFDVLRKAPFALGEAEMEWVKTIFSNLSIDEKVAQLFVLRARSNELEEIEQLARLQPGGITKPFGTDQDADLNWIRDYAAVSKIPPLISADLEGSRMSLGFGTQVLNPLGLAALDDLNVTQQTSRILAREGRAAGVTWSFTPVIDINIAFRSAIVGTRSFGSDIDKIERHALAQMHAFQKNGVAATVKHWPGEGYDDRDQHLVTTINPLSMEEWEKTFGRLYRKAIEGGVMSIMSGHIALPSYMHMIDPDCGIEAYRPASINKVLNIDLLREKLGFNGLIVSDSTSMAGLGSWCSYKQAMPGVIANGCDVILFSNDPEGDIANVRAAVDDGTISLARLDDAIVRILGLKAAQGLHKDPVIASPDTIAGAFRNPDNLAIAAQSIARVPTLVKDTQDLLPLDPEKHKRVLIFTPGIILPFLPDPIPFELPDMLDREGFEVTFHTPDMEVSAKDFDLVLYLFGEESLLTRSHIFIDWLTMTGFFGTAMKRYWHDIPTLMVSFGHPYYLYDAPRMPTYINAYSTLGDVQGAVVECLMGRAEWNRSNPVDPFCGLGDARY